MMIIHWANASIKRFSSTRRYVENDILRFSMQFSYSKYFDYISSLDTEVVLYNKIMNKISRKIFLTNDVNPL